MGSRFSYRIGSLLFALRSLCSDEEKANDSYPTSRIPHPVSGIQYPTSNIPHPVSRIQYPTSHISHLRNVAKLLILLTALLIIHHPSVLAQENQEVTTAISDLELGKIEEVRQQLPSLITKYQDDPGVLYLQGRLSKNGNQAKQYYQTIVTNFPKSQWADDALYHLYQYNYAMGLYRSANDYLQQLAKEYPNSPYIKSIPLSSIPKVDKPISREEVASENGSKITNPAADQSKKNPLPVSERYTLQVGAFSTSANAEKLKEDFEQKGYRVEITNKVSNGKSLYKVWIGAYKTRQEAEKASKEVKSKFGLNAMVIERM